MYRRIFNIFYSLNKKPGKIFPLLTINKIGFILKGDISKMKKLIFLSVFLSFYLLFSQQSFADEVTTKDDYLILFKDKIDEKIIVQYGGTLIEEYGNIHAAKVSLPVQSINRLNNEQSIIAIDPEQEVKHLTQVSGWGIPKIRANSTSGKTYTGLGVKIAILDSGISPHEDLKVSGGKSFVPYTKSYFDDNGHGSHIAGIISAKDNTIGVVGIAPDANLYSVKVLDENGEGLLSDVASGMDWAINQEMDIINLSLGSSSHSSVLEAMTKKAESKGILVVAAAGNGGSDNIQENTVEYPAKYSSVIAVGSINKVNKRSLFSATGSELDVVAPGEQIYSTLINNQYGYMDGTSMAAGYVSGTLAVLKESFPTLSSQKIKSLLTSQSLDLGVTGKDNVYGYGLIQVPKLPERIDGKDRFEVAVNISRKTWDHADTVFITNYLAFADALSASPLAHQKKAPIFLSKPNQIDRNTLNEIKRLGAKKAFIIGGEISISKEIEIQLTNLGINTTRIGGKDRFEVSSKIATQLNNWDKIFVSNGYVFADALSIAPHASLLGAPILLVKENEIPDSIKNQLLSQSIKESEVIGGENSVGKDVITQLSSPTRIGGKNRYEVALNISKKYSHPDQPIYLASGLIFSDALTVSLLIAQTKGSLLLTKPNIIPSNEIKSIVNSKPIIVIGGPMSVNNEIFLNF